MIVGEGCREPRQRRSLGRDRRGDAPLVHAGHHLDGDRCSGQLDDRGRVRRHHRAHDDLGSVAVPRDGGLAVGREVACGRVLEPGERPRCDAQARVARRSRGEPGHGPVQPVRDRSEGVVVERRHLARVDRAVGQQAVPALPHGGRAHRHGVEPRGALRLDEEALGGVEVSALGERIGHERRADEAGGDAVPALADERREPVRERLTHARDRSRDRTRGRARTPSGRRSSCGRPVSRSATRTLRGCARRVRRRSRRRRRGRAERRHPRPGGATGRGRRSPRCRRRPWPGTACPAERRGRASRRAACGPPRGPDVRHPEAPHRSTPRMLGYCASSTPRSPNRSYSTVGTTVAASPHAAVGPPPPKAGSAAGTTSGTSPSLRACSCARSRSHDVRNASQS